MTRARVVLAATAVALVTGAWALLPPRTVRLDAAPDPLLVRGAIHIHTSRSDGAGTPDDVAGAADRAGLDFVVLTDHGDGQRAADAPRYISGVLVIDGVEISTASGHYVAIGMRRAPYRLAGDARDVIEDVRRLGGFGVAAHPDSPKAALRWRRWTPPPDGLEWINADSEWRDETRATLIRAFMTYWVRGPESLAATFDRPQTLARWDRLLATDRIVGLAAADAHARLPLSSEVEPGEGRSIGLPSYEASFRAMSVGVRVSSPLTRRAESAGADARRVIDALGAGHVFGAIDALAGPASVDLHAQSAEGSAAMGDDLVGSGDVTLTASLHPIPARASLVLLQDGAERAITDGTPIRVVHPASAGGAVYRLEARLADAPGTPPVPWIVSNPIYVRRAPRVVTQAPQPHQTVSLLVDASSSARAWTVERHPASEGAVRQALAPEGSRAWHFVWRLAGGPRSGQYAAIALPVSRGDFAGSEGLALELQAPRPMRLSVQLRIPDGQGLRWERSVYVDTHRRAVVVPFSDMEPVEAAAGTPVDVNRVNTLLLVADLVNADPGSAGDCWVGRVTAERFSAVTSGR